MEGPLVTALGHAGLCVETSDVRVLADPWLSETGAFLGSWFPFPDNSHLSLERLQKPDIVVVSHEHLDHLDLDFLSSLREQVRVVIPRYPSPLLELRLRAIGVADPIVLDAWERLPLPGRGNWLTVIPEQCPMSHDAGVLLRVGGQTILHTNDARLSVAQVRRAMAETRGPIDLMGVQMSGASWHPICYDYSADEMARITEIKRTGKFKAATRLVRSVQPRVVLPYAGPPCFLDDDLFEFNARLHGPGIFPDQDESLAWLRAHASRQESTYLLPGDAIDVASTTIFRDDHWSEFELNTDARGRRAYLEGYASRRREALDRVRAANPTPSPGLDERFVSHFESLGTLSAYFLARIGFTVRFDVGGPEGGVWDAHIGPDRIDVDLRPGTGEPQYTLTVDGRWLDGVVRGRTRWEELLLSLRCRARRNPDEYNDYFVGLLKHADRAALAAVEKYEAERDLDERIEIATPDGPRRVGRYCPHAGEDLAETAVVVDGRLRCLGHNFEFDLTTGECVNARCDPLAVDAALPELVR